MMEFYVVIDTNVLVSALLTQNKSSATVRVLNYLEKGIIVPMYNEDILKEYSEVLHRARFNIDETRIQDLLAAIKSRGVDCERISSNVILPDPDDIIFYEVSLSRDDSYLVTGNLRHFPKNGKIVSPADLVQIISLTICPKDVLCGPSGPGYGAWNEDDYSNSFGIIVERIREQVALSEAANMSIEEINEEIRLARQERRKRQAK